MTDRRDAAWAALLDAGRAAKGRRIVELFDREPARLDRLTAAAAGLHLDLSKHSWTLADLDLALALARACGVEAARDRLFAGEAVNTTEDRAVLHPALRAPDGADFHAKGEPVSREVERSRAQMRRFAEQVRSGDLTGAGGRPIRSLLHIGIGGSDLGPRLLWEALKPLRPEIEVRFVANVDGGDLAAATAALDPAETLVIAVSKTFTTQETLANAEAARAWLRGALGPDADAQLAAVTAAPERARDFGVAEDQVFAFQDWVGGRTSVWSAVGLSCAVALGWEVFGGFLEGAAAMDRHMREAPPERSLPVLLALAHVWNRDALGRGARAVVPYAQRLRLLPAYLQQLEMESNGKRVRRGGGPADHPTASAVFGDAGTNGQHAFFQLLHQGTDVIPLDVIAFAEGYEGDAAMHRKLLANALAQAEALMVGRGEAEVLESLRKDGMGEDGARALAPHRTFPGDRPSSFILMDRLDPAGFGALVALYEHKVFVEGALWDINSFDQWGVELGKAMASQILPELEGGAEGRHDPSTAALIARLRGG